MYNNGTTEHWSSSSVFYHIYPLGCFGAPTKNNFSSSVVPRLKEIAKWLPHLKKLHINAIYLGPVFESSAHGYDTADYFKVDRRLGDNQTLKEMVALLHKNDMRVILDGVFNHVGRDFFAFRDLQDKGVNSSYRDWFANIDFSKHSPYGDIFTYAGWNGNFDLVKLNLQNPAVPDYLIKAVDYWIENFKIDGLRIDTADCVDINFLQQLSSHCKAKQPNFWLMGEVIHGDYAHWVNVKALDSVTNYECYKGIYSSLDDKNYFEIAYSLNRQFGDNGIYKHFLPYSFVDNHDVNRLTSNLTNPKHVFPAYCLLFTIPGIPSIYYGSEWGISGCRTQNDDKALRPAIDPTTISIDPAYKDLPGYIAKLSQIRLGSSALQIGSYRQIFVGHEQFAFLRETEMERVLVIVNSSKSKTDMLISELPDSFRTAADLISGDQYHIKQGKLYLPELPPAAGNILRIELG